MDEKKEEKQEIRSIVPVRKAEAKYLPEKSVETLGRTKISV